MVVWRRPKKKQKEGSIEESCRKHAQERGWVTRKMNGFGFRAWPDRFFVPRKKGQMRFWVEFKRPGETSTDEQVRIQKDLRSRGETIYEIDNKSDFIRVFNTHNS